MKKHCLLQFIFIILFLTSFMPSLFGQTLQWCRVVVPGGGNVVCFGETIYIMDHFNDQLKISSDYGDSWLSRDLPSGTYEIFFLNENIGWALIARNPTLIHKTTNAGVNWSSPYTFPVEILTSLRNKSMSFVNSNVGYVCGENFVYKTTDGGNSFTEIKNESGAGFYCIDFANENIGWVVGRLGRIYKTTDGGNNWQTVNTPYSAAFECLDVFNSNIAWAGGGAGNDSRIAVKTSNGNSWTSNSLTNQDDLWRQIRILSENDIWLMSTNKIINTTDGGSNWNGWELPSGLQSLDDFYMISNEKGFAVGRDYVINLKYYCSVSDNIMNKNKISEIYPNPFSNSTTIKYTLDMPANVRINIFDNLGNKINNIEKLQDIGEHQAIFNAENYPQGMYYYSIQIDQQIENGKLLLIR